uniref:VP2 n=1 Tax=Sapovirus pig/AB23/CAN TaxID=635009 RepID=C1JC59_9CALI|nr:VP2 [Sapovirus pig/AB23/CAN]
MSWTAGVLGGLGLLSDIAGNIGNIVAQQQMVQNQKRQLQIQQHAVDEQIRLTQRAQDLNAYLATRGNQVNYLSARQLGFTHAEAQQMVGNARVIYGGVDTNPRALPTLPFYNVGSNSLARAHGVVAQFKHGTTGFTLPQPSGFANPNYRGTTPRLTGARVQLDHNPGASVV